MAVHSKHFVRCANPTVGPALYKSNSSIDPFLIWNCLNLTPRFLKFPRTMTYIRIESLEAETPTECGAGKEGERGKGTEHDGGQRRLSAWKQEGEKCDDENTHRYRHRHVSLNL